MYEGAGRLGGKKRRRKDGGTEGREEALVKREEGSCEVEAG